MKKLKLDYIILAAGIILLGSGLYLTKAISTPHGFLLALPYVLIGVGCGAFGHSMGNIVSYRTMKNNPKLQKQLEIDKNDERNITIINRAKAKAYDLMTFVFGALLLSFALLGISTTAILLFVFAYLFVHGYSIYYQYKYGKEM